MWQIVVHLTSSLKVRLAYVPPTSRAKHGCQPSFSRRQNQNEFGRKEGGGVGLWECCHTVPQLSVHCLCRA